MLKSTVLKYKRVYDKKQSDEEWMKHTVRQIPTINIGRNEENMLEITQSGLDRIEISEVQLPKLIKTLQKFYKPNHKKENNK